MSSSSGNPLTPTAPMHTPSWKIGTPPPHAVAALLQRYWALASFIALPAGFLCASVGSYYINRYARRRWPGSKTLARPDEVLERGLKGFDDKFAYFVHSLPGSYVVAGPCGLLLFIVRNDRSQVIVNGERWREPFSFRRILTIFAREGVGNPPADLTDQIRKMQELLQKAPALAATNEGESAKSLADIPIEGAAVFLNELVQLDLNNPTIPVLRVDQVKEYVRRRVKEVRLSNGMTRALTTYLLENSKHQEESTSASGE
jgi:hypothetical protein